ATINFGVPLLPAVTLDLGDGQSVYADAGEGIAHLLQLERLDNGHDDFHVMIPVPREIPVRLRTAPDDRMGPGRGSPTMGAQDQSQRSRNQMACQVAGRVLNC